MCLLNFVLFFKINFKCTYGECVYVVGNIEALGSWNPARAVKLEWSDGHNWSKKLSIMHDNTEIIEYKYMITSGSQPSSNNVRWENGPNHFVDLISVSKLLIKLNDEWEMMKVRIALNHEAIKDHLDADKRLFLLSNLDNSKPLPEMKLKKHAAEMGGREELFWTVSLNVPNTLKAFNYKYKVLNKAQEEAILDRSHRKFVVKKFPYCVNAREAHIIKASKMVKYDFQFETFSYDIITEDLLVGSFPQNAKDIEELSSLGVNAVLNLQTFEDMIRYEEDWDLLQDCYKKANISAQHFPIIDVNLEDLRLKIQDATDLLHEQLKKGKVFVHCTAGKYRSPHVIISYLCNFRNYNLKNAVHLVKSKRAKVRLFEKVFSYKKEETLLKVSDLRSRA